MRRKSNSAEEIALPSASVPESSTSENESAAKRPRKRRTPAGSVLDFAQEASRLIEATLKSRGSRGATPDILQNVVNWARGIRTEGDELRLLSARPRRLKTQAPSDRLARYEVNRALLDGVLSGAIILDIHEDGSLTFKHSAYPSEAAYFEADARSLPTLAASASGEAG